MEEERKPRNRRAAEGILERALRAESDSIEVETDGAARAAAMIAELVWQGGTPLPTTHKSELTSRR